MGNYPVALTIAGSDSGGSAGIQADLRTFAFHLVHGASVVTCVTAQNTLGVTQVVGMQPELVAAQITAVAQDLNIKAVKLGMLFNQEIMLIVADELKKWRFANLILDPVMVSRTGSTLIDRAAITTLVGELLPLASLVTPNCYEAQILAGMEIKSISDMEKASAKIYDLGAKIVLIKGGAMKGDLRGVDIWYDGHSWYTLKTETVLTKDNNGTGCTLTAAIAANLALGKQMFTSVVQAKEYVTQALKYSLDVGKGTGPVGHFFPLLDIENEYY
jgi:hydroxymethylpyrimidine/phosphomethylpyrimidine kinase